MLDKINTYLTLRKLRKANIKPTIIREVVHPQGHTVRFTQNFVRVSTGKLVQYFARDVSPFHNLYRIVSKPENDFVIHEVKR